MKYLDFFEDTYYINLDYRTDRKELFEKRALEVGIIANRFSAIQPKEEDCPLLPSSVGETRRKFKVGCSLSHQGVIKLAKERNLENVLIFEDDCIFLDQFQEKAKKCVEELKNVEWDILYFGGEVNNYCTKVSENLVKVENGGVYCCHAYAVNKRFYDVILNVNVHHVDILDIFLLNYSYNHRTYILSKELLAIQDGIFSDIKNGLNEAASGYMINSWKKYVP
jgi:GR25 family glycosyltransferase involved in LPS biosynthesis